MKNIDVKKSFETLYYAQHINSEDARLAQRVIDKIADSDKFAKLIFQEYNQCKLNERSKHSEDIINEKNFEFGPTQCGWSFRWNGQSYDLYLYDSVWLSDLDKRLVRKIIKDINVAYLIRAKRFELNK